jgi:hypothetical protein
MWGCGRFDPANGALLLLSEVRVRVACGSLLRQGDVCRLCWNAELRIGPFRFEIFRDRNERRQRGQFRLSISAALSCEPTTLSTNACAWKQISLTRVPHPLRPMRRHEWCPCRSRHKFPPRLGEMQRRKSPLDPCRVVTRGSASQWRYPIRGPASRERTSLQAAYPTV